MTRILLDTHVLYWSSSFPSRISEPARIAMRAADDVAVAAMTWYEIAWLARHERISLSVPLITWLHQASRSVQTIGITPQIAATAVALPDSFPRDPADRLIYATAIEHGLQLVTRDDRIRAQDDRGLTIW